jgi:hypothetical protein
MAEALGRPLIVVAAAVCTWCGLRIAITADLQTGAAQTMPAAAPPSAPSPPATAFTAPMPVIRQAFIAKRLERATGMTAPLFRHHRPPPALDSWQDGGRSSGPPPIALVAGWNGPPSTGRDTPPTNAPALMGKTGQPFSPDSPADRFALYLYSFWRTGGGGATALAPGGEYGGSQSGFIATLFPLHGSMDGLGLLLRGTATPFDRGQEAAFGLRWKPDKDVPVSVSIERRFRLNGPNIFAAYVAGGFDDHPVAGTATVSGFGQIGIADGPDRGVFFDAQAKLLHPVKQNLRGGVGAWAGGQKDTYRLDVGPVLATTIDTGVTKLQIQLDWRYRIAGDARPRQSAALTISSSF